MALPTREIDKWIGEEVGWIDGILYPLEMAEYLYDCEHKLQTILNELREQFGTGICEDLRIKWNKTRFDLTCRPIPNQDAPLYEFERNMEIMLCGYPLSFSEPPQHYECKVNLTYNVELHWIRRPNNSTSFYSIRFAEKLKYEDVNFECFGIKWISDEFNGQMFTEEFKIDFSKEISEEYAKELCEEFNRLNSNGSK